MVIRLDSTKILEALSSDARAFIDLDSVQVFSEIPSTQEQVKKGDSSVSLVAAEFQSAGKGRKGRAWSSEKGGNVMMSCSWGYDEMPKQANGMALALAVVLAELLVEKYSIPARVKWPNDILVNGQKLAGILLDTSVGVKCKLYVGLGLNVDQSGKLDIEQSWVDLYSLGVTSVNRNVLIADIFSSWVELFNDYPKNGFEVYQQRWCDLSEYKGRKVTLSLPDGSQSMSEGDIEGVHAGVDVDGCLCIETDKGVVKVMNSEYSLRTI